MPEITNLIFAGVGGQGVLLIAELTAQAAVRAGFDVKQTEVHGVSQRGGSVESHVRYGDAVHSPLVAAGQADVVIGLEKLEALRYAHYVRQSHIAYRVSRSCDMRYATRDMLREAAPGVLLVNDYEIIPGSVANAAEKYPHNAIDFMRDKGLRVVSLRASERAKELGDGRMANVIMLGALSTLLSISETVWIQTVQEKFPAKYRDANLRAFQTGRSQMADGR
ncbi:MAG: indolepyruvate oxidoreductase subunit beta [Chloroflexota bacterium]